jgi:O-glycosyl hydrolase
MAVADETSIDLSINTYKALSPEAKKAVDRINTHSYGGSRRAEIEALAKAEKKHLWMSEADGSGTLGGEAAGDMGSPLWLANHIITDMNGMMPSAWVIWLVVDRHRSDFNRMERNNISLRGAYWGTGISDHIEEKLLLGKRYYAFGQFTRYIRPGDRIIASSPSTLAAWNRESGKIVVVAVNSAANECPMTFDLSAFPQITANSAKVICTSGPVNAGENWNEDIPAAPLQDKKLEVQLAPFSITTFVIE